MNDYPIDYVLTYVDDEDPVWRNEIRKYTNCSDWGERDNDISRYRNYNTLFYLIPLIEKNLPWVRFIHLVVAYESQVPKWLTPKTHPKVKIVYHRDIIPQRYLPTFNSGSIEMFLFRIPNLAEHFIYGNDDMYPVLPLCVEDFFRDGIPVSRITDVLPNNRPGDIRRINAKKLVTPERDDEYIPFQEHSLYPYTQSALQECYETYKDQIEIPKFRTERSHSQKLLAYYMYSKGYTINDVSDEMFSISTTFRSFRPHVLGGYRTVCVNDIPSYNPARLVVFKRWLRGQ